MSCIVDTVPECDCCDQHQTPVDWTPEHSSGDHAGPQQGERGVRLHQVQVATHRQEVRAQDVRRLPGPLRGGIEDTGSVRCKTTLSYWHSVILSVSTIWCQEPSVVPLDVPAAPVRPAQRGDVGVSRQGAWQRGGGDYDRYISTLSHSTRDQDNRDLTRKVRTQVQWCPGVSQITPQPGKYFSKGLLSILHHLWSTIPTTHWSKMA